MSSWPARCKFWLENRCQRGDNCWFYHGKQRPDLDRPAEPEGAPPVKQRPEFPPEEMEIPHESHVPIPFHMGAHMFKVNPPPPPPPPSNKPAAPPGHPEDGTEEEKFPEEPKQEEAGGKEKTKTEQQEAGGKAEQEPACSHHAEKHEKDKKHDHEHAENHERKEKHARDKDEKKITRHTSHVHVHVHPRKKGGEGPAANLKRSIRRMTRSDAGTERPTCDTAGDRHENNMSHRYHYIVLQTGGFEALRALRGFVRGSSKKYVKPPGTCKAL